MTKARVSHSNRRFLSLRVKLLCGFTLVFSVVFSGAYYWFYTYATQRAMERIEEDLVDTLEGAIAGVNGEEFAALAQVSLKPGQDVPNATPIYWKHQEWLNKVHKIEPRANPYTFVQGQQDYEILWIGDIFRIIRRSSQTRFKDAYIANPSDTNLYKGFSELTITMKPYGDEWGHWVSAYGPIRDGQGRVIGGMGIDFRADYVLDVQKGIRDSMIVSFAITYASLFFLVYVISGVVTRPIIGLTRVAEQIGEGDYGEGLSQFQQGRLQDEISSLSEVFELMVSKVQKREENLKQKVAELKIEIDQAKRQSQVNEIVETDFFQELQAKARQMRMRCREDLT